MYYCGAQTGSQNKDNNNCWFLCQISNSKHNQKINTN